MIFMLNGMYYGETCGRWAASTNVPFRNFGTFYWSYSKLSQNVGGRDALVKFDNQPDMTSVYPQNFNIAPKWTVLLACASYLVHILTTACNTQLTMYCPKWQCVQNLQITWLFPSRHIMLRFVLLLLAAALLIFSLSTVSAKSSCF